MMNRQASRTSPTKLLTIYTLVALFCVVIINLLSAYIRLSEAGLDCQPWPNCYAIVEQQVNAPEAGEIAQKALAPTAAAKQAHRGIATIMVVVVLLLVQQSRKPGAMQGVNQTLPYALLGVILLLSVIGPASYMKTTPIIALINILGGMTLMALCWIIYLQLQPAVTTRVPALQIHLWNTALALLVLQLALGSWMSANFAGAACSQLLDCSARGDYLNPGQDSFWYFRELAVDSSGRIVFDNSTWIIHISHRVMALISATVLVCSSLLSYQQNRVLAAVLLSLVALQCLLGAAAVLFSLPLIAVLLHNFTAALVLLAVIKKRLQLARNL